MVNKESFRLWCVGLAALIGLIIAFFGLFSLGDAAVDVALDSTLDSRVVALVNGKPISKEQYSQALATLAEGKNQVSADDKSWVRQRLVDEELLVQRGLALGLAQTDITVRSAIVRAMINSVTVSASAADPEETVLRKYYQENIQSFRASSRLRARAWQIEEDKLVEVWALPNALLPPEKIREYLGPAAMNKLLQMEVGETVKPFSAGNRKLQLTLLARQQTKTPKWAVVRPQVLDAYQREAADQALRDYLLWLASKGDLSLNDLDTL